MYVSTAKQSNEQAISSCGGQWKKTPASDTWGSYFPDGHTYKQQDDEGEETSSDRCPCHPFQIHISASR